MPRIPRPLFKLATAGEAEGEGEEEGIAGKKAAPFAANFVNHDIVINFCSRNTKRDSRVGVRVRLGICVGVGVDVGVSIDCECGKQRQHL